MDFHAENQSTTPSNLRDWGDESIAVAAQDADLEFIALIDPEGRSYWYDQPEACEAADALSSCLAHPHPNQAFEDRYARGTIGLISYDDYSGQNQSQKASKFWNVKDPTVLQNMKRRCRSEQEGWPLEPHTSEKDYLQKCAQTISEIRLGRYYQSNILRYYNAPARLDFFQILERILIFGGPFSAWIRTKELEIISFSPEQFIVMSRTNQGESLTASTFPIKGTSARQSNPKDDETAKRALADCPKNRAELSMIIDLMRNDFHRISQSGNVRVTDPGSAKTFATVHHLVGQIDTEIAPDLRVGEFLRAVCPAGSITGAPKIESMKSIQEKEKRSRGYLMGNITFHNPDAAYFNSSVLIRTITRTHRKDYEFSAGSGIVLSSNPNNECDEIAAKGRCVTQPIGATELKLGPDNPRAFRQTNTQRRTPSSDNERLC